MRRRTLLLSPLLLASGLARAAEPRVAYPAVEAGVALRFPRDHGSHPAFRTEWWYLTGQVQDGAGTTLGLQITFFRSRPGIAEDLASRFAPRQLLFAHAALAWPARGQLLHDQRAARAGLGLAEAALQTTDVRIDDWSLRRMSAAGPSQGANRPAARSAEGSPTSAAGPSRGANRPAARSAEGSPMNEDTYVARIAAREFSFDLRFRITQPPLLQGDAGLSRKGPRPSQASYYYSLPQLAVTGRIAVGNAAMQVAGTAWLDHEWSSAYLASEARGWDWTGINLDDGGALMAFRIRHRDGSAYWAGGTHRGAAGGIEVFGPQDVRFEPLRRWRSPRTGVEFPVAMRVVAGAFDLTLEPLLDDQELDARTSVGTIYWEGAVLASRAAAPVGRGYLELTGYGAPLRL